MERLGLSIGYFDGAELICEDGITNICKLDSSDSSVRAGYFRTTEERFLKMFFDM